MNKNLSPRHDIPSYWRRPTSAEALLHLGENPFPPTERVHQAIAAAGENANRYPDTNGLALREKLAEYAGHGVQPENIILGNGSDELIDLAAVTFSEPASPICIFPPTFFVYGFSAQRHGIPTVSIPLTTDYRLPEIDSLDPQLSAGNYSLSFIANPNNPTGTLTPRERLLDYLKRWPGIIVVDECYYEYSGETIIDLIPQYPNLLLFRSLSKSFGLSGLRLGYAVGQRPLIDAMERCAMTFPINVCAQAAGVAALEDADEYRARIRQLIQHREELRRDLDKLGLEVVPSYANFLLTIWPPAWNEKQPAQQLAQQGILVSDQSANMNQGRPALRIAIGTPEENERLRTAIRSLLKD